MRNFHLRVMRTLFESGGILLYLALSICIQDHSVYSARATKRLRLDTNNNSTLDIKWPFFATLSSAYDVKTFCAATIISDRQLITSRSCAKELEEGEKHNPIKVFIPSANHEAFTCKACSNTDYQPSESINGFVRHSKDYSVQTFAPPISLKRNSDQMSILNVSKIHDITQNDSECYVLGHSVSNKTDDGLPMMSYAPVEYKPCWMDNEWLFCFRGVGNDQVSTCRNDSGGAVVCKQANGSFALAGVVSSVPEDCDYKLVSIGIENVAANVSALSNMLKGCDLEAC